MRRTGLPARRQMVVTTRRLVLVNIGCAAVGLAQGIFVARQLGPATLGVIGIAASALALVANFLDIRPGDLASKLFYQDSKPAARAGVLQMCFVINVAVGVAIFVLGTVVAAVMTHLAAAHPPGLGVVLAQSAITSSALVSGTPVTLLRLTERLEVVAGWRIAAQLSSSGAVIAAVAIKPTMGSYYVGGAAAAIALLPASIAVSIVTWRTAGVSLTSYDELGSAYRRYRNHLRFLIQGNVLGYTKMLHRGADVLLVAFATSDVATGVYRLARQLTDGLYLIFDATAQVYTPRLLSLLADRRYEEFREAGRRLVLGAFGITAFVEAVAALGLPFLADHVLNGQYVGLTPPILLLVLPFMAVMGVHLWLWAALIDLGQLPVLVRPAVLGALAQAGFLVGALPVIGHSPTWAAVAYLSYYLISYSTALVWMKRHRPDLVPRLRSMPPAG